MPFFCRLSDFFKHKNTICVYLWDVFQLRWGLSIRCSKHWCSLVRFYVEWLILFGWPDSVEGLLKPVWRTKDVNRLRWDFSEHSWVCFCVHTKDQDQLPPLTNLFTVHVTLKHLCMLCQPVIYQQSNRIKTSWDYLPHESKSCNSKCSMTQKREMNSSCTAKMDDRAWIVCGNTPAAQLWRTDERMSCNHGPEQSKH